MDRKDSTDKHDKWGYQAPEVACDLCDKSTRYMLLCHLTDPEPEGKGVEGKAANHEWAPIRVDFETLPSWSLGSSAEQLVECHLLILTGMKVRVPPETQGQ